MRDSIAEHRDDRPDGPVTLEAVPSGLFAAWRRALAAMVATPSRVVHALAGGGRLWSSRWRDATAYHRHPAAAWEAGGAARRQSAAALGVRAFIFGIIALAILTASARNGWGPGIVAAGAEVLWAGMRFIIIALLMPRGAINRTRLSAAFLAGLVPYAIACTWLLRLVALLGSAVLTYRGIEGAGVSRGDARVAVGWGFGGQAAVLAGGWIVRAVVALLAMR